MCQNLGVFATSLLSNKLSSPDFHASKVDISLFLYIKENITFFVTVYEDDIVAASSSEKATIFFMQDLQKEYSLKDLGDLHYFLGIEVTRTSNVIVFAKKNICIGS